MLTVDNINFKGNFRYMGATINSLDFAQAFEVGKDKVSKELVEFSQKSAFLNKLKEDRDVFLHHHREITLSNTPKNKGFFAKIFSKKQSKNNNTRIGKEHLTIVFENKKAENIKETELCEINITLPINKGTPSNLDRFGKILDSYISIKELRKRANQLFPENSHKLTLLPSNTEHGWCEFWTGEKTSFDTLDRLHVAMLQQLHDASKQLLSKLIK